MRGTIVYFDFETAGLFDDHPEIQIAAIAVRDWQEIDAFEAKIQFDAAKAEPEALRLNGYNPSVWREKAVPERMALERFCDFCKRHATIELVSKRTGNPYSVAALAGMNIVAFDIPRLRRMAARNGDAYIPACWWYPYDVYQRALWHFAELDLEPPPNYQLATLAEHFGIAATDAHDALADVRLAANVAQKIVTWNGEQQAPRAPEES